MPIRWLVPIGSADYQGDPDGCCPRRNHLSLGDLFAERDRGEDHDHDRLGCPQEDRLAGGYVDQTYQAEGVGDSGVEYPQADDPSEPPRPRFLPLPGQKHRRDQQDARRELDGEKGDGWDLGECALGDHGGEPP